MTYSDFKFFNPCTNIPFKEIILLSLISLLIKNEDEEYHSVFSIDLNISDLACKE